MLKDTIKNLCLQESLRMMIRHQSVSIHRLVSWKEGKLFLVSDLGAPFPAEPPFIGRTNT